MLHECQWWFNKNYQASLDFILEMTYWLNQLSLREKCPNTELFPVRNFPHSD